MDRCGRWHSPGDRGTAPALGESLTVRTPACLECSLPTQPALYRTGGAAHATGKHPEQRSTHGTLTTTGHQWPGRHWQNAAGPGVCLSLSRRLPGRSVDTGRYPRESYLVLPHDCDTAQLA